MMRLIEPINLGIENELKDIFFKDGIISPFSSDKLTNYTDEQIQFFALKYALYGIFTTELIELFKTLIKGRKTIEVGAGGGTLGRALGVPMFDNYLQLRPEIAIYYIISKQPAIKYGNDVVKLDGLEAIKMHRPAVVVGSWLTHKYNEKLPHLKGSQFAFNQYEMFDYGVQQFIMYGSLSTHKNNPLFKSNKYKTEVIKKPGIMYSRNGKNDNVIYSVTKK